MVDSLLGEVRCFVGFVVEADNSGDFELLKDGDIVVGCEDSVLGKEEITLYLSIGLSDGELNAMNLLGIIQLRSPFSIF